MPNYSLPPTPGDPLADSVLALLERLKNIAPNHPLINQWGQIFTAPQQSSVVANRLHGVIGFFIMRKTDNELLELQAHLEQLLKPHLHLVNRKAL